MIHIRDLPDEVHSALRIKAARAGLSLSEYLRRQLELLAQRRSVAEVLSEWHEERSPLTREEVIEAVHEGRR